MSDANDRTLSLAILSWLVPPVAVAIAWTVSVSYRADSIALIVFAMGVLFGLTASVFAFRYSKRFAVIAHAVAGLTMSLLLATCMIGGSLYYQYQVSQHATAVHELQNQLRPH